MSTNTGTNMGLWIDHKLAVIVTMKDPDQTPETVTVKAHHSQNKETASEIKHFFDDVLKKLEHAESVLIFGPGEAKDELHKLFKSQHHTAQIVGIESADKLTENQVVAKVRDHYNK